MTEQLSLLFCQEDMPDKHEEGFLKFKETEEGRRFLDMVYKRVHVAYLEGRKVGIKRECEDVRWNTKTRFNNNWTRPLGRWLVAKDPRFADVFSRREIKVSRQNGVTAILAHAHAAIAAVGNEIRKHELTEKLQEARAQ